MERLPKLFWVTTIISGTGKGTDFKFCWAIHMVIGSIGTKAHEKCCD